MRSIKLLFTIVILIYSITCFAQDAFPINGVSDKSIGKSFTINVPVANGYSYLILLNGNQIPEGTNVVVSNADYYQLVAYRTNINTMQVTNRVIQFIVRSSERGVTEDGLPPWTPYPTIPSCNDEFEGGALRVIIPKSFPSGFQIPVIAWIVDENLHALKVNGVLKADGYPDIKIRRGVGSGFLPAQSNINQIIYTPIISQLQTNFNITIEGNTSWTEVSGVISGNTTWHQNSRIYITTNLTINSGATLTIEKGTIIRINYRTDITNNGSVVINGTIEEPVVFMPNTADKPWGGFVMRQGTGEVTGSGVIFTGSGAEPNWFGSNGNPGSHRKEQGLFYVGNSQQISLTDSAAIYLAGQLGHSLSGGTFIYNRFLLQRCTTGGEYTGASFTVNDSAFVEFPDDTANFVDGDNDAIYIVSGNHWFTNTLFGWTKDDGIDSGGGSAGVLQFSKCWFESTFHEGNSLSGDKKNVYHRGDVFIGCGQGLEAGYDGPNGYMIGCLAVNNLVGGRFGDNYDWTYNGSLTVSNSILIYNYHDIWGMNWADWTYRANQMDIRDNLLTVPNTNHLNNAIYNPQMDAYRLTDFGAKGKVGIGFALRTQTITADTLDQGIPVGLSIFSTNNVIMDCVLVGASGVIESKEITFSPGEVIKKIAFQSPNISNGGIYNIRLANPINGELTGMTDVYLKPTESFTLISKGAVWKYIDDGSDQGDVWRGFAFNDSGWKSGPAELGFGDGEETTVISRYNASSQQIITYYFRRNFIVDDPSKYSSVKVNLLRDDGGIVYINGIEVFRSNMPAGTNINYLTNASSSIPNSDETVFFSTNFSPDILVRGTNICAVEIHQANSTSSDVSFNLELVGVPQLRLKATPFKGNVVIYWDEATAVLEKTGKIGGKWDAVSSQDGIYITPTSTMEFYRLKR